jgi:hypothetical protein
MIAGGEQAKSIARRSRQGPCWRYGVFVTATFRKIDGAWRLALEAVSRMCPVLSLPEYVQAQVALCRGGRSSPVAYADTPMSVVRLPERARVRRGRAE